MFVSELLIEVQPSGRTADLARHGPVMEDFATRADDISSSISTISRSLQARFDQIAAEGRHWDLHEIELNFELQLQAEAGAVITKVGGSASIAVHLSWSRDEKS